MNENLIKEVIKAVEVVNHVASEIHKMGESMKAGNVRVINTTDWLDVKACVPHLGSKVMVKLNDGAVMSAVYRGGKDGWDGNDYPINAASITHWAHIVKPSKPDSQSITTPQSEIEHIFKDKEAKRQAQAESELDRRLNEKKAEAQAKVADRAESDLERNLMSAIGAFMFCATSPFSVAGNGRETIHHQGDKITVYYAEQGNENKQWHLALQFNGEPVASYLVDGDKVSFEHSSKHMLLSGMFKKQVLRHIPKLEQVV